MADPDNPDQSKTAAPLAIDAIEPAPARPASSKDDEQTAAKVRQRPEREPKPADYFRVFTYATPFDVGCFVAAGLASSGAGIVSNAIAMALSRFANRGHVGRPFR